MKIQYRKATLENLYEIMELIKSAIINMNQAKIYQWDEIYPDEATIKYDIENNDLTSIKLALKDKTKSV